MFNYLKWNLEQRCGVKGEEIVKIVKYAGS